MCISRFEFGEEVEKMSKKMVERFLMCFASKLQIQDLNKKLS
jgi:hypothetical protein